MKQNKSEAIANAKTVKEIIDIENKYPNEATFGEGEKREVNQDNYFEHEEIWKLRKRFMKFNVIMEILHETLDLDKQTTTMEQLIFRIQDIVIATRREE